MLRRSSWILSSCNQVWKIGQHLRTIIIGSPRRYFFINRPLIPVVFASVKMSREKGDGQTRHMTRENTVLLTKEKFLSMTKEEKRKLYKCGPKFCTLSDVLPWPEYLEKNKGKIGTEAEKQPAASTGHWLLKPVKWAISFLPGFGSAAQTKGTQTPAVNADLNSRVSIWKGDITKLEIDAIANAANTSLLGGGGVDGAIHSSAGSALRAECETLHGCDTGDAKITAGYKLPARYVIHTVGPIGHKEEQLRSCYKNCLKLLKENKLKSLALPCISTGIYGYPNEPAAHVALETVRAFLETDEYGKEVERIVFCLFLPKDVQIYQDLMKIYFPVEPQTKDEAPSPPPSKQIKDEPIDGKDEPKPIDVKAEPKDAKKESPSHSPKPEKKEEPVVQKEEPTEK